MWSREIEEEEVCSGKLGGVVATRARKKQKKGSDTAASSASLYTEKNLSLNVLRVTYLWHSS